MKFFLNEEAKKAGCEFRSPNKGDAGYDIYASRAVTLFPGEQKLVNTGLHIRIPNCYVGIIKDRSSMALKGLHTHAGVIDCSYRGEVGIVIENTSQSPYVIEAGDRIAQLILHYAHTPRPYEVKDMNRLGRSHRNMKGFGSTGK